MPSRRTIGFIVLVLLIGGATGTLFGELLGLVMPEGVVKEFFLTTGSFALGPATLDAQIMTLTLGISFRINVIGIIGISFAVYLLRWVLN